MATNNTFVPVTLSQDNLRHEPATPGQVVDPSFLPVSKEKNNLLAVGEHGLEVTAASLISKVTPNMIEEAPDGGLRAVFDTIVDPSDKVLMVLRNGLLGTELELRLAMGDNLLQLLGKQGELVGEVRLPVVPGLPTVAELLDDFLPPKPEGYDENPYTVGTYLHFRYKMSDGTNTDLYVNLTQLVDIYTSGFGISINAERKVSVNTAMLVSAEDGNALSLDDDDKFFVKGGVPDAVAFVDNPAGQLPGKYLELTYIDPDGKVTKKYADASLLVDVYTSGTYIDIVDGVVSVDATIAALPAAVVAAQDTADSALASAQAANGGVAELTAGLAQVGATAEQGVSDAASAQSTADSALAKANEADGKLVPMVGATTTADGLEGLVPQPGKGAADRFLAADGTWKKPVDLDTTYGLATATQSGLMSSADKVLIDTAHENGQLGDPQNVGIVDANTLIETGVYVVNLGTDDVYENHWPVKVSSEAIVRVYNSGTMVQQIVDNKIYQLARRRVNGVWEGWSLLHIGSGEAHIYISKNGSNSNLGLTPDAPVQTAYQAVSIANAMTLSGTYYQVYFHFGAGDWGNITFDSLPYHLVIASYDGNNSTDYSEELPKFSNTSINNCLVNIRSIIIEGLLSCQNNSYVTIEPGYKRIYRASSIGLTYLSVGGGIFEIGQPTSSGYIFGLLSGGNLRLSQNITFKLIENVTVDSFITAYAGTAIDLSPLNFNNNGYTFIGNKVNLLSGSRVDFPNTTTFDSLISNFFGQNSVISSGVILNGVSTGNVNKAGDTMTGDLYIKKDMPRIYFTNSSYDMDSWQAYQTSLAYLGGVDDKNGNRVYACRLVQDSNKRLNLKFELSNPTVTNKGKTFNFVYDTVAGKAYILSETPALSKNDETVSTTLWVNQKLGTGASTASLALVDETAEDYVETFEIRKLKAAADLNAEASEAIKRGFRYEIDGEEYLFNYGLWAQQNLADLAVIAMRTPADQTLVLPCRNETGHEVELEVLPRVILDVHKFAYGYKQSILSEVRGRRERLMAAENDEQLNAIMAE